MSSILLVEDDINLGLVTQDTLKDAGHKVKLCTDGKQGLIAFNDQNFDLCLLDVMLPEMDGFELAEAIRKVNQNVPLIFLTAKSLLEDKIKGLEIGADDYITKPFSSEEFLLRVKAILKRSLGEQSNKNSSKVLTFGGFQLFPNELKLTYGDTNFKLTKKEGKVLELLAQKQNEVIERELLLKLIWGNDSYFNGRSLDVFISKLRKHLKADESVAIENIHGVGFKLVAKD